MNQATRIKSAIGAHGLWKGRLRAAIETGQCNISVEAVRANDRCEFGKWLQSPDMEGKNSSDHHACRDLHGKFHLAAAHVLTLALAGKKQEALNGMAPESEFVRLSIELSRAMMAWIRNVERSVA